MKEIEVQIWSDFLLKQLPVIVVLSIFCYYMYKYFTATIEKKDASILSKDKEIKELHEQLLAVTRQSIEAQNKNTEAQIRNGEIIRDLKEVIQLLNRKIDR